MRKAVRKRKVLNEKNVLEIYKLLTDGVRRSEIAKKYSVTEANIHMIAKGFSFKFLFAKYKPLIPKPSQIRAKRGATTVQLYNQIKQELESFEDTHKALLTRYKELIKDYRKLRNYMNVINRKKAIQTTP